MACSEFGRIAGGTDAAAFTIATIDSTAIGNFRKQSFRARALRAPEWRSQFFSR
jgi:hypothetical protein